MNARAVVPYSASSGRDAGLAAVFSHLDSVGLQPFVTDGNSGHKDWRWSPGRARNFAVTQLPSAGVVVFNDADSICPPEQIRAAIMLASAQPGLVFAYDLYCRWTQQATEKWCASADPWNELGKPIPSLAFDGKPIFNSGSMACVAISRACFEEVGGFDESYVGWGYEDLDFAWRCNKLWPNRRVSGPVYHLWHGDRNDDDSPTDSDPVQVAANKVFWCSLVSMDDH